MSQSLVWIYLGFLLIISTGCASPAQPQPPVETKANTSTVTSIAPTATLSPSETPTPTIVEESSTTPSTETLQPATAIDPFLTSAGIRDISWSPDSAWLRFLSQTSEDIANSPGGEGWMPPDPGTVHYYNVRIGEGCSYEENNPEGLDFNRWSAWLPDDRIAVLAYDGQLVALEAPCASDTATPLAEFPERVQDVYGATRDNSVFLLKGETI